MRSDVHRKINVINMSVLTLLYIKIHAKVSQRSSAVTKICNVYN